jgi:hypothetical protein
MPLIKPRPRRVRVVRHICRLQEPNRAALVLYARFIGDTPDYVLNRLLETALVKDKEFVAWQAAHAGDAALAPPTAAPPTPAGATLARSTGAPLPTAAAAPAIATKPSPVPATAVPGTPAQPATASSSTPSRDATLDLRASAR